jgi:hypothetical protein
MCGVRAIDHQRRVFREDRRQNEDDVGAQFFRREIREQNANTK